MSYATQRVTARYLTRIASRQKEAWWWSKSPEAPNGPSKDQIAKALIEAEADARLTAKTVRDEGDMTGNIRMSRLKSLLQSIREALRGHGNRVDRNLFAEIRQLIGALVHGIIKPVGHTDWAAMLKVVDHAEFAIAL